VTYVEPPFPDPVTGLTEFSYINCAGVTVFSDVGDGELGPLSRNVCARIDSITLTGGDESATWAESTTGDCCACINYEATGTGTLIYTDCTGEPRNYNMTQETLIFCAQGGSPSYTIGITLTENGSCDILCREYQIDGEGNATFMDCFGNPGQAFSNEFFCAANGTVSGSGSIGIIGACP
jgi:hypothetical protein